MRRAAEGPDLAVAELDEPVNAFPEGLDVGFAGRRRLDRRDRPFDQVDPRDPAAPLAPVGPEPDPPRAVEQERRRLLLQRERLPRGEVVDHRIGHVPVPAVAIDGLRRPGHDDQARRSVPRGLAPADPPWRGGELDHLGQIERRRVDAADAAVAEAREDRFALTPAQARHFLGVDPLANQADRRQFEAQEGARRRQGDQVVPEAQAVPERVPVEVDGVIDDTAALEPNLTGRRPRRLVRPQDRRQGHAAENREEDRTQHRSRRDSPGKDPHG